MRRKVLIPISEQSDSESEVSHQNILNWLTGLNGRQFTLQIRKGGELEYMNGPAGLYPEGQLNAVKELLFVGYTKAGYRYMSWSEVEDGWELVGTHSGRDDGEKTLAYIDFKESSATSSRWLASQLNDPEVLEEMQNVWEGLGSLFG
jgi:hypothetical protein